MDEQVNVGDQEECDINPLSHQLCEEQNCQPPPPQCPACHVLNVINTFAGQASDELLLACMFIYMHVHMQGLGTSHERHLEAS